MKHLIKFFFKNMLYGQKLNIELNSKFISLSWQFLIFMSFLFLVIIFSSHKFDQKINYLDRLNKDIIDLKSNHINLRISLSSLSSFSNVSKSVSRIDLVETNDTIYRINFDKYD
ncbi:MAG: hypothetical protein CBE48_000235 [Flavobacteriales bacterium TMED288]|nr:hypothetical protein [Flavobacteriales bacterium]RPG53821.1 MAG: hypothetical protein CBE48_000235 [Flavobacteriales bacterium TMED288]|tara:strand:- start:13733 stop:14074 length:342 start_codon:yes stop_codon:yes gene_type:complete